MCFWKDRDLIYQNRKKQSLPPPNLRRKQILDYAQNEVRKDDNAYDIVDFVFVDKNCKLKLKSITGRIYGFSSEFEFLSLVSWLGVDDTTFENDRLLDEVNEGEEY